MGRLSSSAGEVGESEMSRKIEGVGGLGARNASRLRDLLALLALATLVVVPSGCGDPVGTECRISGSGFHARHGCRHRCLSRWQVSCPDGRRVTPNTCSGAFGCRPGSCPDGQVCYHDDDPFDDRSFCVVATTCGEIDRAALAEWERESLEAQERMRAEREAKQLRRERWRAQHPDAPKTAPDAP